ncbi:MAG: FecR domain-containing protein [Armatimonadota bacterium]|nr:FecR domain-containing protein [bacterium]
MNRNHQTDPIELLSESYYAIEMSDEYRRELLDQSRSAVAARQRTQKTRWVANLAGVASVFVISLLVWYFIYSVMENPNTPSHHNNIATGVKTPVPTNKPIETVQHGSNYPHNVAIRLPVQKNSSAIKHQALSANPASNIKPILAKQFAEPIVAVISVQQPVTDGAGKALKMGDRLSVGASVKTGKSGRITLVTRKGSELHLDSNSTLTFTSNNVAATNRGRLYCSNRDKEIARIDTPAGRVRLLGTVVNTVVRRDTVAVTVVEGKVELSNRHGSALVDAGNRSLMVAYRPPRSGVHVNAYKETSWYLGRGDYQSDFGDLAYTVQRGDELVEVWMMKSDGSDKHRVRSFIGACILGTWEPGERLLSVKIDGLYVTPDSSDPDRRREIARDGSWRLLLDAATGQSLPFYDNSPEGLGGCYVAIAPDPSLVALSGSYRHEDAGNKSCDYGLYVCDRTIGKVTRLLSGEISTIPAWSPDSRYIAISSGQEYTVAHNLVIIDVVTGQIRNLGINGAGACFSPDGKKIAYSGNFTKCDCWSYGVPLSGDIYVLDLASKAKPLKVSLSSDEGAVNPRWSPDGTRILYQARDRHLSIVNADGSDHKDILADYNVEAYSWAQSGDAVYVTIHDRKPKTLLVSADGSGAREVFGDSKQQDIKLPPEIQAQTDAARAAIYEAALRYIAGCDYRYDGNLAESRKSFRSAANLFAQLVWAYPLSGLGTDDTLRYADAAIKLAGESDDKMLEEACHDRMAALSHVLYTSIHASHVFPQDIATLQQDSLRLPWWQTSSLLCSDTERVKMLFQCPGMKGHRPTSYIYSPPPPGKSPIVGDVILRCPLHPSERCVWEEWMNTDMVEMLMANSGTGACRRVYGTPYAFENFGNEPLTIIYHKFADKYEVHGTAKLLPTGSIITNTEFSLPTDRGSIARAIDAVGNVDWGNLPADDVKDAEEELEFCRAIAQYEAGIPVTDYKTIDGEPARLLFNVKVKTSGQWGSFGPYGLNFLIREPNEAEVYELEPSCRFRVFGTVRVLQTRQVCTNGWIDKNGQVISTEK